MQFQWLRRLIRRNTRPIPEMQALVWKRRLSILYGLLAWHAFGLVCYMMYTGRGDWAHYYGFKSDDEKNESQAVQFSKSLAKDGQGKIIRYSGFRKIEEIEFDYKKKEI